MVSAPAQRILLIGCLVLTALGIAALSTTLRLKRDVARLQNERLDADERERVLQRQLAHEQSQRRDTTDALQRERAAREPDVLPSYELRPGPPRPGARSLEIAIPAGAPLVDLVLRLPAALSGPAYRAGLRSAPGDEFWMQSRLTEHDRAVTLHIPAAALPPADYELRVQAIAPNGTPGAPTYYYFAVK